MTIVKVPAKKNCFNSKLTKWLENLVMILCVLVSWVNLLMFIVTISYLFYFHDTIVCRWIYNYLCNAYHHLNWEFESHLWWDVLDTTLCDKVCQWLPTGQLFSPGTLVSSTNKTDRHDITEIMLKVTLNTMNQSCQCLCCHHFCHIQIKHNIIGTRYQSTYWFPVFLITDFNTYFWIQILFSNQWANLY